MATEIQLSPPPKDDTVLWKYMPDENFDRLLVAQSSIDDWAELPRAYPETATSSPSRGSLWLSLPQGFEDKDEDEGTFPALNRSNITYCENAGILLGVPPAARLQRSQSFCDREPAGLRDRVRTTALLHGVSCWTRNCQESRDKWNKFARRKDGVVRGVAIRTTCRKLREAVVLPSLDSPVPDGMIPLRVNCPSIDFDWALLETVTVTYVDLERDFLLRDGARNLLRLKDRKDYADEAEVRCIGLSPALTCLYRELLFCSDPPLDKIQNALKNVPATRQGYCVLIDLEHVIEEIRTYPGGNTRFREDVAAKVAAKELCASLVRPSVLL
jgi:hypothetical protein